MVKQFWIITSDGSPVVNLALESTIMNQAIMIWNSNVSFYNFFSSAVWFFRFGSYGTLTSSTNKFTDDPQSNWCFLCNQWSHGSQPGETVVAICRLFSVLLLTSILSWGIGNCEAFGCKWKIKSSFTVDAARRVSFPLGYVLFVLHKGVYLYTPIILLLLLL